MNDSIELAWRLYQEHLIQGRHHESQRASVSQYTIAIATALGGLAGLGGIELADVPLAALVFVLGLFGALFSAKQYERFRYHMAQAKGFRAQLEAMTPGLEIALVKEAAKKAHKLEFPRLAELRLNMFWVSLHLLIALFGAVLIALALAA